MKKCQVPECAGKVVSKGLCDKHRIRLRVHGHLDSTRPSDWGSRSKHELYGTWRWIRKRTVTSTVPEWDDFWCFVKDVGDRPSDKHTIRRIDESKPYGPDNFFWKERLASSKDANAYARAYRKKNPLVIKSSDLKRRYGLTIDEYHDILDSQGGGCGICGTDENPGYAYFAVDHCHETNKVRGLLCNMCNRGLGFFQDSHEVLDGAARYLKDNQ